MSRVALLKPVTPKLDVIEISFPLVVTLLSATSFRSLSASLAAPSSGVSGRTIINSSPPYLPETPLDGAARLAERLRKVVADHKVTTDGNDISITSSFGVTGFNRETLATKISAEKIIGAADKYLYQAKETGRNKVISGPL